MLTTNMLLEAMQGIRPENVQKADAVLGCAEQVKEIPHVSRRLWTTLLVAAILISLLTVTAYALGWFQISRHGSRETYAARSGKWRSNGRASI